MNNQIHISASATILFLDDSLHRLLWVRENVSGVKFVRRTDEAIAELERAAFDFVFLDYDLGLGQTSEDVARYLQQTGYSGTVVIHSTNPFGQQVLSRILPQAIVEPFGTLTSSLYRSRKPGPQILQPLKK